MSTNPTQNTIKVKNYVEACHRYNGHARTHLSLGGILVVIAILSSIAIYASLNYYNAHLGLKECVIWAASIGSGTVITAVAIASLGAHYEWTIDALRRETHPTQLIAALKDLDVTTLFNQKNNFRWIQGRSLRMLLNNYTHSEWKDLLSALDSSNLTPAEANHVAQILLQACPVKVTLNFWAMQYLYPKHVANHGKVLETLVDSSLAKMSLDQCEEIFKEVRFANHHARTSEEQKKVSDCLFQYLFTLNDAFRNERLKYLFSTSPQ